MDPMIYQLRQIDWRAGVDLSGSGFNCWASETWVNACWRQVRDPVGGNLRTFTSSIKGAVG